MKTNPEKHCPRYDHCSVNNCPLTVKYPNHVENKGDAQQKCTMEKNVRKRIAAKFPANTLKCDGMTPREHSAFIRFELLDPAVKSKMAEMGSRRLEAYRNSQKGQNR
jgi:hypothetical protein